MSKYKKETVTEYKKRMWGDFRFAFYILAGLAVYIFIYSKFGGSV